MLGLPAGDSLRRRLFVLAGGHGQLLEAEGGIDGIAKDGARDFGFAVEEQGGGFIMHRFCECTIALRALEDGVLEVP